MAVTCQVDIPLLRAVSIIVKIVRVYRRKLPAQAPILDVTLRPRKYSPARQPCSLPLNRPKPSAHPRENLLTAGISLQARRGQTALIPVTEGIFYWVLVCRLRAYPAHGVGRPPSPPPADTARPALHRQAKQFRHDGLLGRIQFASCKFEISGSTFALDGCNWATRGEGGLGRLICRREILRGQVHVIS